MDVRVNGGAWEAARIVDPQVNRCTCVRFDFPFAPAPGDHVIETRTTDRNGNGNAQPASVPLDKGGHNFSALPKFMVRVV